MHVCVRVGVCVWGTCRSTCLFTCVGWVKARVALYVCLQVCRCGVCVYMCYVYVHACARMCVCVRARGWTRPRSLSWPVDLGPAHLARPAPREATPLHGAPGWSSFPGRLGRGLGRVGARPAKDSSGGAQVGPRGKAPRSARPPPNWPPARETASRERETALEAEAGGGGGTLQRVPGFPRDPCTLAPRRQGFPDRSPLPLLCLSTTCSRWYTPALWVCFGHQE